MIVNENETLEIDAEIVRFEIMFADYSKQQ